MNNDLLYAEHVHSTHLVYSASRNTCTTSTWAKYKYCMYICKQHHQYICMCAYTQPINTYTVCLYISTIMNRSMERKLPTELYNKLTPTEL